MNIQATKDGAVVSGKVSHCVRQLCQHLEKKIAGDTAGSFRDRKLWVPIGVTKHSDQWTMEIGDAKIEFKPEEISPGPNYH